MEDLLTACTWHDIDAMEKPRDELRAAVAALHDAGFVHGDLRACNVMVDEQKVCTDLYTSLQNMLSQEVPQSWCLRAALGTGCQS